MNSLTARNKTLGQLLAELRSRLGFMAMGSAAQANGPILTSFLQEAHDYVHDELLPPGNKVRSTIALQPGSSLYDWHDDALDADIDPSTVLAVWLSDGDSGATGLTQGITEAQRASQAAGVPERYDTISGQIELWPAPQSAMTLVVEHIATKPRFEQAADKPAVSSRLVFLYALANAKAHYRQPDAQAAATSFSNMLRKAKSRQRGERRYFAGAADAAREPKVVKTSSGYRLQA